MILGYAFCGISHAVGRLMAPTINRKSNCVVKICKGLRPWNITSVHKSTAAASKLQFQEGLNKRNVLSAVPTETNATKLIIDDRIYDFKYIWLRDNCKCSECIHPDTKQKLLDSPSLCVHLKPKNLEVTNNGDLKIHWAASDQFPEHNSFYSADWLYKYGQCFAQDAFEVKQDKIFRPPPVLWDRVTIWNNLPEISYREFMETEEGLFKWLDIIHKFGFAVMREVPLIKGEIQNVVNRFAYIKETSYGLTFDVISEPDPKAHLAYSGRELQHHTDMNYREKSPGLQLLHCLKANDLLGDKNIGGKSFFVDGFYAAKWLQDTHPASFHVLTTVEVKFSIINKNLLYSQHIPIVCLNKEGELEEIHVNNRTMGPLQVPRHLVLPFYHAYKQLTNKIRDSSCELRFNMVPGDLVVFNNRRVLHGRTAFDPSRVSRHLHGCYVDIDEALSRYDALLEEQQQQH